MKYCFSILLMVLFADSGKAQDAKFILPLHGVQGIDYFIDYYVDHDFGVEIRDAFCGKKALNGHMGTDFVLRSFKTMDSGINVYAISDGVVSKVSDGDFDRNKRWLGWSKGNEIEIIDANKYHISYTHLKKGSVRLRLGDTIKAGQAIAQVGSSGNSNIPHLHLEIQDTENKFIDPFSGKCHIAQQVGWLAQPAYDTALYVINTGFAHFVPSYDSLVEHITESDTFYIAQDSIVCFWAQLHGVVYGSDIHVEWYDPKGNLWGTYNEKWKAGPLSNSYAWPYIHMPQKKGEWTVDYFVNDKIISIRHFYVRKRS